MCVCVCLLASIDMSSAMGHISSFFSRDMILVLSLVPLFFQRSCEHNSTWASVHCWQVEPEFSPGVVSEHDGRLAWPLSFFLIGWSRRCTAVDEHVDDCRRGAREHVHGVLVVSRLAGSSGFFAGAGVLEVGDWPSMPVARQQLTPVNSASGDRSRLGSEPNALMVRPAGARVVVEGLGCGHVAASLLGRCISASRHRRRRGAAREACADDDHGVLPLVGWVDQLHVESVPGPLRARLDRRECSNGAPSDPGPHLRTPAAPPAERR